MSYREQLPFARGSTLGDGHDSLGSTFGESIIGRIYEAVDTKHDTSTIVRLRVVRNESEDDITVARKCYCFGTDAGDLGRCIDGLASADGQIVKALDDHYTVGATISDNDCFYVVEEGVVEVTTEASAFTLAQGCPVQVDDGGLLGGTAAADNDYVVGWLDEAEADAEGTEVLIHAAPGLGRSVADPA